MLFNRISKVIFFVYFCFVCKWHNIHLLYWSSGWCGSDVCASYHVVMNTSSSDVCSWIMKWFSTAYWVAYSWNDVNFISSYRKEILRLGLLLERGVKYFDSRRTFVHHSSITHELQNIGSLHWFHNTSRKLTIGIIKLISNKMNLIHFYASADRADVDGDDGFTDAHATLICWKLHGEIEGAARSSAVYIVVSDPAYE